MLRNSLLFMDILLITERGTENYVCAELKQKGITGETIVKPTAITVKGLTEQAALKAAYLLQTPLRVCWALGETDVSLDTEETVLKLETMIGALDLKAIFPENKTFHVACRREGMHEYNSVDISQAAGRLFKRYAKESLSFVPEVDLKKPELLLHLHVEDEHAWLGLDLIGKDASKRPYKIFNNPHSIKGPTAASLLMAADWQPGMTLIDPYAGGGEIPIEAALFVAGRSVHYFDKDLQCKKHPLFAKIFDETLQALDAAMMPIPEKTIHSFDAQLRNVTAEKKNAKIAGVEKDIVFSKLDIEWLDTKLSEKSIDRVITQPVESSKHVAENKAMTLHKSLFYQADFFLKKDGKLVFICSKPDEILKAAEQYKFKLDSQEQIYTGKLAWWVAIFVRA